MSLSNFSEINFGCNNNSPIIVPLGDLGLNFNYDCSVPITSLFFRADGGALPLVWTTQTNWGVITQLDDRNVRVDINASPTGVGVPAYLIPRACHYYSECITSMPPGKTFVSIAGGPQIRSYDCHGNLIGFFSNVGGNLGPPPYHNQSYQFTPHLNGCSGGSQNLNFPFGPEFPGSAPFVSKQCDPGGTLDIEYSIDVAGILVSTTLFSRVVHDNAQPFHGIVEGLSSNSICNSPNQCQEVDWDSFDNEVLDIRSQAMIDAGCSPCKLLSGTNVLLTVTDANLVTVGMEIHIN